MCMNLKNAHPFTESVSLLKGILCTTIMVSSGCWPFATLHTYNRLLPKGLMILGVVPTSAVKVLVGL